MWKAGQKPNDEAGAMSWEYKKLRRILDVRASFVPDDLRSFGRRSRVMRVGLIPRCLYLDGQPVFLLTALCR
ncbi:MAG: hypothetical protein CMO05_06915 [Thalassospira sp.]|nr:hypothetical protein [Thalassospira sp.]